MVSNKFRIGADFTFFAVIAMFVAFDTTGFALMSLAVCAIHEAGHLTAMLITKQKPSSILFRGGGIKITTANNGQLIRSKSSLFVVLAGSTLNIALFFGLYFTLAKTDIYPIMFAVLNLVTGLFNLLPVGCLDGKRLLEMFVPEKPLKVIEAVAFCIVFIVIAAALFKGGVNFTLAAAMIYIISVDIFSGEGVRVKQ